ncbi:hypothetical protein GCM10027347_48730 [Larkinella harenae]
MKTTIIRVAFLMVAGGWWIAARPGDIVNDLGLTVPQVQEAVFTNLTSNQLTIPYSSKVRQLAKKIPDGSRDAAVQALGAVVHSYVHSDDFKTRYQRWLKDKYQISSEKTQVATQAQNASMKDMQTAYDQQATMVQNAYTQMPPATLAMMLQSQLQVLQQDLRQADDADKAQLTLEIKELKRLEALSKSKPAEFKKQYVASFTKMLHEQKSAMMDKAEEDLDKSKREAADYQKRLAEYKAASNLNVVVKQHLNEFIALTETVDFGAQLTKQGSKLEFVKPEYRNQSSTWKLLYRLGKEPVMAARSFAQRWAKEL